jgi:hypothetical protein
MNEEIINQARYICVSIPYDKDDEPRLISFDDGLMTELRRGLPKNVGKSSRQWHLYTS